jgi:SAM-dependent methyltransferase
MSAQYDEIGGRYAGWKETPVPTYAELPTVRRLLVGQIEGREVLDLACGTGYYSRKLKQWGAARVVGVDVSQAMIAEAREAEAGEKAGIEYVLADAATLPVLDAFDLATAMYLLHYAETPEAMRRMCWNIAANLKSGGTLVALLPEPDYVMGKGETEPYGFTYRLLASDKQGMLVHADVHTDPPFSIEYRHWARWVFEDALCSAGFTNLRWHPFEVSPEGLARFGEAYWRDFLANPVSTALTARLP